MKDPVCGMDVKPEQAKGQSTHNGQTYHFCSNDCKQKFDKSPDSYSQKGGHQGQHGGQTTQGTHQPQGGQQHQSGEQQHQGGGHSATHQQKPT
jgi:Cu+-exporting ATPase